jgi:hypothetical protein
VWWYFFGVYVLSILLAAFVLFDSLRAQRGERLAALREPAPIYPVGNAVFLVIVFAAWLPQIPRVLTAIPVFLTPFVIVLDVAYLLRVVFPKPPAETPSADTDTDAPATHEDTPAK